MSTRRLSILAAVLAVLALALPAAALAGAPAATTEAATLVGSTTATLNGTVDPNKETTKFHFEYGTTTAYGSTTPEEQVVPRGNSTASANATIQSLQPSTTYHFRLVASNPSGSSQGVDMTFTTLAEGQAPPGGNAVTIMATPASVLFGRSTVISGQLTGDKNADVDVTLESQPAGGSSFTPIATGKTDASGNYSFTTTPLVNTDYRVEAKSSPKVTSPVQRVNVRMAVSLKLSDATPKRGTRVRFKGVVKPAHPGATALIQRRAKTGKFVTVSKTLLKASTKVPGQSTYSKRLRIRKSGVYRVRVPADADHARGTSRKRTIKVH